MVKLTRPIALQLYNVRGACRDDFFGTLRSAADIGYAGVEFARFYDTDAGELRRCMDGLGIKPAGSHTPLDVFEDESKLKAAAEYSATIGNEHLVLPWLPRKLRKPEGYRRAADALNRASGICKPLGIKVAYHDRNFEFAFPGGDKDMDIFLSGLDDDVNLEVDIGWVWYGSMRSMIYPAQFTAQNRNRVALVHLKNRIENEGMRLHLLFQMANHFPKILDAYETTDSKVRWYIVEQNATSDGSFPDLEYTISSFHALSAISV